MSATTPTRGKPRRCPHCGRTYEFRLHTRQDSGFGVGRYHRHHGPRAYVYFHEIVYRPHGSTKTRDPPIEPAALRAVIRDDAAELLAE